MEINHEQIGNLPEEIRDHLRKLVRDTDLPDNEESFELLAAAWIEKEKLFTGQTGALDMEQAEIIGEDDERGMLMLTKSGSLLSLWPAEDGVRDLEYASIAMRTDVPEILKGSGVQVAGSVRQGEPVELSGGSLKKTSPIYRIAVCAEGLDKGEQAMRVREATIFLTNGFARINKLVGNTGNREVEHFTKQSIAAYIAQRSGLTQKAVREVIDDYLSMIETGVLLGETVNLGGIGRLSVKLRPPQKARVGRNPATGEEMTIPAKPAQGVPKISFSSHLKERAAEMDLEEE